MLLQYQNVNESHKSKPHELSHVLQALQSPLKPSQTLPSPLKPSQDLSSSLSPFQEAPLSPFSPPKPFQALLIPLKPFQFLSSTSTWQRWTLIWHNHTKNMLSRSGPCGDCPYVPSSSSSSFSVGPVVASR